MVNFMCHDISHTDQNGCGNIWIPTSDSSQVSQPVIFKPRLSVQSHRGKKKKRKKEERDECNLTAHNIPFPILCSTFSVILSQLKNCLMLMHSDLEIKHQSGSLLVDSVGLHVSIYTNQIPTGHIVLLGISPFLSAHRIVSLALDKHTG